MRLSIDTGRGACSMMMLHPVVGAAESCGPCALSSLLGGTVNHEKIYSPDELSFN